MNPTNNFPTRRAFRHRAAVTGLLAPVVLGTLLGTSAPADMYQPPTNTEGGVQAQSTITSITPAGTNTTVCWYGMQGWYTIEASTNSDFSSDVIPAGVTAASDFAWCATVANPDPTNAYFFRLNQNNAFAGSGACTGCHGDKADEWSETHHAHAYSTIANLQLPPAVKETCYPCHTVGMHQPTGFTDITNTPHLTDVGCENCHGPAAWHKYSDHDLIHPAVSLDPKICGGCHTDDHHPTYNEYTNTLHAQVNDHVADGGSLTVSRMISCGICHSAASRMAMLNDYESRLEGNTNALALPTGTDAALWTAACATCHDPHSDAQHAQLRNPIWSTNYYTMASAGETRTVVTTNFSGVISTNVYYYSSAFANMYNPDVQVCGQCHNSRGARWDGRGFGYYDSTTLKSVSSPGPGIVWGVQTNISFSRPPHHSPQYNLLSGIVQDDYLDGTNVFGAHSLNTNGCAACHMAPVTVASPSPESPNYTGHEFLPLLEGTNAFIGCAVSGCHNSTAEAGLMMTNLQSEVSASISSLVSDLNAWSLAKGPGIFGTTNYGENGWEYTNKGELSTSPAPSPNAANQLKIPTGILQARFNLYMAGYGNAASLGVHNPTYTRFLLNDASNKVWQASQ